MRNIALIALLAVSSFANAQDIPTPFHGKWVGTWKSKIKASQVKAYCQANDVDNALTLKISTNAMQMDYWEARETVTNFKFSQVKPNYLLGTAKFVQSGFVTDENGDLTDKDIILNRKIEFTLKNGELIELYRENLNETGKPIWYKRYWKKCN